jgi:hypothetical protein
MSNVRAARRDSPIAAQFTMPKRRMFATGDADESLKAYTAIVLERRTRQTGVSLFASDIA